MTNCNPETGIRYGVTNGTSLDPAVLHELCYGPDAKDLSYHHAYQEAKAEAEATLEAWLEEAEIAAAEAGADREIGFDRDQWNEWWFQSKGLSDPVMFVEDELERFSDLYYCDEPNIEGVYEGTPYLITWLGGAILVYITGGIVGYADELCSPCVPNAADLDSGFHYREDLPEWYSPDECLPVRYECYVPPRTWLCEDQTQEAL